MLNKIKHLILGKPRNPLAKETRGHITLIAFFAWIALGADGLSSISYGPEASFIALGKHTHFSLHLGVMVAITVFLISMAYNQAIELFPSGGGGYKVATRLIGKYIGLVAGVALILGYILTISLSVVAGVDALYSLLPINMQSQKILTAALVICGIMYLNLRGIKESVKVFLPIFISFVIAHILIIVYGVIAQSSKLPSLVNVSITETFSIAKSLGWFFVIALLLRAFSLGAGTYTGLEAVSNNVNNLAEPRVRTGKVTMLYMAISLSFMASGILLLYFLWNVQHTQGQTLNASVFGLILNNFSPTVKQFLLTFIMFTEAGLLFIGANTGFLGGAAVLSNMAIDGWVPRRFRNLSSRLVVQNGIVLFGVCALLILFVTHGSLPQLLALYASSVFVTFTLTLLGLSLYWIQQRSKVKNWVFRLALSFSAFVICATILTTMLVTTFTDSGWLIILSNGFLIILCLLIAKHYRSIRRQVKKLDEVFTLELESDTGSAKAPKLHYKEPTAVFFIGDSIGESIHTVLWAQRMFPGYFKNFVFVSVGLVDVDSYESEQALEIMQQKVNGRLKYFTDYATQHGIASKVVCDYGTDPVAKLVDLSINIHEEFKTSIFFSAKIVFKNETWLTRQLHNETPLSLQRSLHMNGMQMIIVPVLVGKK